MMMKTALATANAPSARAITVVELASDTKPKPQKSNIDQKTTMTRSGQETGLANCSDIFILRFWIKWASAPAADTACRCAGVWGLRLARNASIARRFGNAAATLSASG